MTATKTTGLLRAPGVTFCYEVRGSGPMLLISQSGEGEAGRSTDLVDQLADVTALHTGRRD
jgi:hypothetical protein